MMTSTAAPYISIIIPVHNQAHLLKKLLRSIWAEDMPAGSYEVIVTDDGSASPAAEALSAGGFLDGRTIRLLRHERSKGAAAARNNSCEQATGEVLLFLDADTILERGSLRRVYDRFRNEPSLGAVNGGGSMDPANPEDGFTPRYRALLDHIQQNRRAPASCTFFTPRLGAVRKKYFDACGRYDPNFPGASVEEYEFGYRLAKLTPIAFDPEINVLHHYQKFWKNCRNFFSRVRFWMKLFRKRKKFENFGSVTSYYGAGSVFGAVAAVLAPFVCTCWAVAGAWIVCFALFLGCYAELFVWTLRLKGPVFMVKSILLSWWLCLFITAGAIAGAADALLPRRS